MSVGKYWNTTSVCKVWIKLGFDERILGVGVVNLIKISQVN